MRSDHLHPHDFVVFGDLDSSHPSGRSADLPHLVFRKVNGLSQFCPDKEMLFPVGQFGRDEFIPFVEVNGNDPACPGIAVGLKRRSS